MLKNFISSLYYGFLDLTDSKNFKIKDVIQRTITALQDEIANAHSIKICNDSGNINFNKKENSKTTLRKNEGKFSCMLGTKNGILPGISEVDVNTYCKLGHLHLLMFEYSEGKAFLTFLVLNITVLEFKWK